MVIREEGIRHWSRPYAAHQLSTGSLAVYVQRDHEWHSCEADQTQIFWWCQAATLQICWSCQENDWTEVSKHQESKKERKTNQLVVFVLGIRFCLPHPHFHGNICILSSPAFQPISSPFPSTDIFMSLLKSKPSDITTGLNNGSNHFNTGGEGGWRGWCFSQHLKVGWLKILWRPQFPSFPY